MHQKDYWERQELSARRRPEHPVIAAYVKPKIDVIRRYVDLSGRTRLLDVGCGNGFFTYYFDKICDAHGVDYSDQMLRMNPARKTYRMDANHLEFDDDSFEVVFSHAMLHHVHNIDAVIGEMRRVSSRYVVLLEPNRNNPLMFLFALLVREERPVLRFSLSYLRSAARRNGLRIIDSF